MKSNPEECMYCLGNTALKDLVVEIAKLKVSRVYLFKEQTYWGRCLVAYQEHVDDLSELTDDERNAFMADVVNVSRAMKEVFKPIKINYGAYSDKLSHLHFHLVPKYVDGPDFGGTFLINPRKTFATHAGYEKMVAQIREHLVFD